MDGLLHASRLLVFSCSFLCFPLTTDPASYLFPISMTMIHEAPTATSRPPPGRRPRPLPALLCLTSTATKTPTGSCTLRWLATFSQLASPTRSDASVESLIPSCTSATAGTTSARECGGKRGSSLAEPSRLLGKLLLHVVGLALCLSRQLRSSAGLHRFFLPTMTLLSYLLCG